MTLLRLHAFPIDLRCETAARTQWIVKADVSFYGQPCLEKWVMSHRESMICPKGVALWWKERSVYCYKSVEVWCWWWWCNYEIRFVVVVFARLRWLTDWWLRLAIIHRDCCGSVVGLRIHTRYQNVTKFVSLVSILSKVFELALCKTHSKVPSLLTDFLFEFLRI